MPVKAKLDLVQVAQKHITVEVELKLERAKEFKLRLYLVELILRVLTWVAPFEVVVVTDDSKPGLFYCPHCGCDNAGRIPPDVLSLFTIHCKHCHHQITRRV